MSHSESSSNFSSDRSAKVLARLSGEVARLIASSDEVVYLDTEYIHAALSEGRYRPTEQDWKEVVQIGAVKWNHHNHRATGSFVRLVKPTVHANEMTQARIADLEKITPLKWDEIMSKGHSFVTVYRDLQQFIGNSSVVVMLGDGAILQQNCADLEIQISGPLAAPMRLKPILCEIDEPYFAKIWSGMLHLEVGATVDDVLKAANSTEEGCRSQHDGLFDACSMALFVDTHWSRASNSKILN